MRKKLKLEDLKANIKDVPPNSLIEIDFSPSLNLVTVPLCFWDSRVTWTESQSTKIRQQKTYRPSYDHS